MYNALSEIPVPTAAQFLNDYVVQLNSSIKDNVRDNKRSLTTSIFVGSESVSAGPAVDTGDIVASIAAPDGSVCYPRRAVLRETVEKKRYLEMWVGDALEVSKDVTESHGAFYSDEFFSGLSFSPSQLAFMYVAEANEPTDPCDKFKFTPHLGETLAGKKRPTIYIFRWEAAAFPATASLARVSPIVPDDHTILFGQPVFSPVDPTKLYATGYEYTRDGRLLGLKWCLNRPSGIWEIELPSATHIELDDSSSVSLRCLALKLTPSHLSCRSPRIYHGSVGGTAKLFWLSHASAGPHAGTFALQSRNLAQAESTTQILVDTVWEPRVSDGFPGLYLDANLPVSPFIILGEEAHFVFSSDWGSRSTVLLVSTADGTVRELTPDTDEKLYSWSMLATDGRSRLVCARSAPSIPYEVVLGQMNLNGEVNWRVVYSPHISPSVRTALSNLRYSLISVPDRGKTQTVVIRPRDTRTTPPCVQYIHGGPHGSAATAFSPNVVALAIEGYCVSMPNYSGSTGFGETSVRALVGNCGTLDVQDCLATARHLVELGISAEGKGKQFVMGGSHGGFLTAHLIGQFPDVFTAAVIRNPVISTDPLSSDIPDWYFNEWDIDYPIYSSPEGFPIRVEQDNNHALPPRRTPSESQRIFASSPIAYVDAVKANVLLHLGGSDLRVTPTHGLEYYHALKGRTRNERPEQGVEMHWFEKEGHSLDGMETSRVLAETTREWFNKYRT
ncbi:Alpha/Beta hydrolase protein [Mycena vitilis]|nr:Alpha/Beta hydrolase protein [Mycena vitilis]